MEQRPLGSRYLLGRLIGRGAMGEVYAALARDSDDRLAIKVLRSELTSDPDLVQRFVQERSILCSLDHPNLVRVRDLVVEGETLAIVMDLAEGSDLRKVLREQGTLPPALAAKIVALSLAGLDAAHAVGVVHRDLKPENIIVNLAGSDGPGVRVTDFGIARVAHGPSLTRLTRLIGTPEYLAPELTESPRATPAADIYSAGILLYELLAGRTPFAGGHPMAVMRGHLERPPDPIPGLDSELWSLITQMLAKRAEDRPSGPGISDYLTLLLPRLAGLPALPPVGPPDAAGMTTPGASYSPVTPLLSGPRGTAAGIPVATVAGLPEPGLTSMGIPRGNAAGATPTGTERRRSRWYRPVTLTVAPVMIVAGLVFVLSTRGHRASAQPSAPSFASVDSYANGIVVGRKWDLQGAKGDHLHAVLDVANTSAAPISTDLEEAIPKSVADVVDRVTFHPQPDQVVQRDPIVAWHINLDAGAHRALQYDVPLASTGGTQDRLNGLAADQHAALAARHSATGTKTVTLATLVAFPTSLTVAVGQPTTIQLSGTMSDGTPAPAAVLSQVAWSTKDATIAVVDNGSVTGVGAGTVMLIAQAGTAAVTVSVTVPAPASSLAGGTTTPDTGLGLKGPAGPSAPAANGGSGQPPVTSPATDPVTAAIVPRTAAVTTSTTTTTVYVPPPTTPATTTATPAPTPAPTPPPTQPPKYYETSGNGPIHTWTNYTNAGGYQGPSVPAFTTVEIACKVQGFRVSDGDVWWYRIAQGPWNSTYYGSADAFYNNGQTSGSLIGTPFVDYAVPNC